ncbi:carbohydrate ABC transporter permease [Elioraea sp.]|uniref:carbohydrate ABC transporter permease n=1 Tax=Elioraea sp. TaxID=2185103 RepID=UPI0025C59AAC|nr:carbohydrate ABC transporter permease [Elioraea sp.]
MSRPLRRAGRAAGLIAYNLGIWAVILVLSFPLIWMVLTAFKPRSETLSFPPSFLPRRWTLEHFERVLNSTPFLSFFANSLIVAVATTCLVMIVALFGAYSLARFTYPGRRLVGRLILFTYLLPSTVVLVPLYLIVVALGLANTLAGLVLVYTTFALPFALWLLHAFVASMPLDTEEAARVDGASRMGAFFDVVVPQALPGLISTALFTFILSWNEYLFSLVFITDTRTKTLPSGVTSLLLDSMNVEWNMLMAASVLITLPVLIFFAFLQKHLTKGFGAGSVKG